MTPVYSENGGDTKFKPGQWVAPDRVAPEVREEARKWLVVMMRQANSAGTTLVQRWLFGLLPFVALKGMKVDEAKEKVAAYAVQMQNMPEYLFTQASLGAAARKFKWFPDYSDLMDWFDSEDAAYRNRMERAMKIAQGRDKEARNEPATESKNYSISELARITGEKDRLSGWAERDPRPVTPTLPYQGIENLTMEQRQEIASIVSDHADKCMSWGNRMRERDLAAIKAEKANAKGHAATGQRSETVPPASQSTGAAP